MFKYALMVIAIGSWVASSHAMVYDNQFFPLYERTFTRTCDKRSAIMPDLFFMTGHTAFGDDEDKVGIPEIFGRYDEINMGKAVEILGFTNPIPVEFQNEASIPWQMRGKIEGQGGSIQYHQHLWKYFSAGFNAFFMHVISRIDFSLDEKFAQNISESSQAALDLARRIMNDDVGIKAAKWEKFGFSDVDCFIRFGNVWDYTAKCKRIDLGLRAGILVPSGVRREIDNPASVPFGGDGRWGIYGSFDGEFELKEDLIVGFLIRMNQRFGKMRHRERLPLAKEQQLYAAYVNQVSIEPGFTFILAPYVALAEVRNGLNLQVKFTLVHHDMDYWQDNRLIRQPPLVGLAIFNANSSWTSEYVTLTGSYDFGKVCSFQDSTLAFSLMWDIPVRIFLAERVSRTNRISIGVVATY